MTIPVYEAVPASSINTLIGQRPTDALRRLTPNKAVRPRLLPRARTLEARRHHVVGKQRRLLQPVSWITGTVVDAEVAEAPA